MQTHPDHELAGIFPLLEPALLGELAADIAQHGLHEPIVLLNGAILDGRNRYRACQIADIEPTVVDYEGDNPLGFVISLNLHRRHLSEGQRAMAASKIATLPQGSNQHASIEAPSQERAAELLNVSRSSVQRAAEVRERAQPMIVAAAEQGRIAVSAAAQIAKLPPVAQDAVAAYPEAARPVAKAIRTGDVAPLKALGQAIRPALEKAVGKIIAASPKAASPKRPTNPAPLDPVTPISNDWPDWTGAVQVLATLQTDLHGLVSEGSPTMIDKHLGLARVALPRLQTWIVEMEGAAHG